jgi:ubiquinone biosynthesis O-methyltransferase
MRVCRGGGNNGAAVWQITHSRRTPMTTVEPTCDLPGLDPDTYARWRASQVGMITERVERRLILDLIGDVRGESVLDVGCGDGDLAVQLSKHGGIVSGIDISEPMIEAAKQRAARDKVDIDFRVAAGQDIPFPAEQFDIVAAVTILCFVENPAPIFDEVARVLRPGGRFIIGELGKWSSWAAARRIRAWSGSPLWRKGRFRTARELRMLATRAGLEPTRVHGAVYYPRFGLAARLMAPWDHHLGGLTTIGAAFVALEAVKPPFTH